MPLAVMMPSGRRSRFISVPAGRLKVDQFCHERGIIVAADARLQDLFHFAALFRHAAGWPDGVVAPDEA